MNAHSRCVSSLVLVVVATCLTRGIASQDVPIFRSGVDLLTVDATVIGTDGRPDATLGVNDFTLKVDGKPRRIVSAQFVAEPWTDRAAELEAPRHFSSNEFVDPGRFVVVAVDEPHIRRVEGRAALNAAATFVDRLAPADRVAVLGLGRGGRLEFTRDRVAARSRLNTLTGQGDPAFLRFNIGLAEAVEIADGGRARLAEVVQRECGRALTEYLNPARAADDAERGRDACPEQVEQEARASAQFARTQARISLSALEGVIASLKELNRPSTLVLLSEGMVADPRLVDFAELSAAAQAARVSIYVLHIETPLFEASTDRISPTLLRDVQVRGDGLARLAGSARGGVFRLVGGDAAPFERIANELSGHYLVAFEPLASERDGRLHRVELNVTGAGTVRARHAFRLPATATTPRSREQQLVTLLRSALPLAELPVRVATYTYVETTSPDVRLVVSTETEAAASKDGVTVGYVLVDSRGVIAASGAHRTMSGRHAFTTRVPKGTYTLRVGAIDALGRRGIVARTFPAAVQQQRNLQVSDLILAPAPLTDATALQPIVDRAPERHLVAYVEIAAVAARSLPQVKVNVEVVGEQLTPTGVRTAAHVTSSGGLWARARADLRLEALAAGRYVAIARVMSGDEELARVSRPFTLP